MTVGEDKDLQSECKQTKINNSCMLEEASPYGATNILNVCIFANTISNQIPGTSGTEQSL